MSADPGVTAAESDADRRPGGEGAPDAAAASDIDDLLGLVLDPERDSASLVVEEHLLNLGGNLWGGCGLAAAMSAGRSLLGRDCAWASAQFVSLIRLGETLNLVIERGRHGRALSQVVVRGMVGDHAALVVTGTFGATIGLAGQYVAPPDVVGPGQGTTGGLLDPARRTGVPGWVEQRWARPPRDLRDGTPGPGRAAFWLRPTRPLSMSGPLLAILADFGTAPVADVLGRWPSLSSLDNSIRLAPAASSPEAATDGWVLLDGRVDAIVGGVAHLSGHVFDTDGRLLASVSQSAVVRAGIRSVPARATP